MRKEPHEFRLKNNKNICGWIVGVGINFILLDKIKDYEAYLNSEDDIETERVRIPFQNIIE